MQKQNEGHGLKFCCRIWLSIKNDYRTLIGADELDLVEKAEDEDDEDSNA